MAIVYCCDRCKCEKTHDMELGAVDFQWPSVHLAVGQMHFDLCRECSQEVRDFVGAKRV